jgi:hypothetical protein
MIPASTRVRVIAFVVLVLVCTRPVQAQETTESVLKGAFIYNFTTFTEWPPTALMPGMPITVCVVGDPAVADAVTENTAGRQIDGHDVVVTMRTEDTLQGCHVLYVSSASPRVVNQALAAAEGSPILTISDVNQFARRGGVAELFVDAGKMRFRVNLTSAMRSQLELSSRLLSLAEVVYDPD